MRRDCPYVMDDRESVADRLLANTSDDGECKKWNGYLDDHGYPRVSVHGKRAQRAHRVMYRAVHGDLPDDMVVHHVCAQRACVNPDHLQAVSGPENSAEMLERRVMRDRIELLEALLDRCECHRD